MKKNTITSTNFLDAFMKKIKSQEQQLNNIITNDIPTTNINKKGVNRSHQPSWMYRNENE